MSDFPRGWTYNASVSGAAAALSITVPATPGVIHILDSLLARMFNYGSAGTWGNALAVQLNGSGINVLVTQPAVGGFVSPNIPVDEVSFSGLDIATATGGQLLVAFANATVAGIWQELTIQGHDI